MIKLLRIENLILIESAQIPFEPGLNILSGETGAGKSAIMQALRLIAGDKGDPKHVRHGAIKGIAEALFEPSPHSPVWAILEAAGIQFDPQEPLVIRRELPVTGKSRAFINNQLASLSLLKEAGETLFDIASQHASLKLSSESFQRNLVDTWGELNCDVQEFGKTWNEECALKNELNTLIKGEAKRLRDIESGTREIEEIEEAKLDPSEEETLFQEYSELATGEERYAVTEEAMQLVSSVPLNSIKLALSKLAELDSSLTPLTELFNQAKIEMEEISWGLNHYQSKISFNPHKMADLDDRLKLITKLKKKYGATIEAILIWLEEKKAYLETLASSEDRIMSIKEALSLVGPLNDDRAVNLTYKRKVQAERLSKLITREIHELNMSKAEFYIDVSAAPRGKWGQDSIQFLFQPNVGGKKISVKDAASGGELARIFLAIKTLLAEKEESSCLVFDEVDANIGGETARLLGEKLAAFGKKTQVIAVTHFPQVAAQADHHLQVKKLEIEGKTVSVIQILSDETRPLELARMLGQSS